MLFISKGSGGLDNDAIFSNSDRKRKLSRNLNGALDDSDSFGL